MAIVYSWSFPALEVVYSEVNPEDGKPVFQGID